ncbi:MAG: metallophosphoesterase [Planctomycetota bacterium]
MRIWAISDLHLALGVDKPMHVFGEHWREHHHRIAAAWDAAVEADDLVLLPGDLSWATKPHEVAPDFAWLADRPGEKVLIKGNHDYWWPTSQAKLASLLPPRTHALKKRACRIAGCGCFGARGGDFAPLTVYGDKRSQADIDRALDKEERELRLSLEQLAALEADPTLDGPGNGLRLCLFHYPPIPAGRRASRFTPIIAASGAALCVYGHLHGAGTEIERVEGHIGGVDYRCTSCDLVGFAPVLLRDLAAAPSGGDPAIPA